MKKWLNDEDVQKNIYTFAISGIMLILFFFFIKEINVVYAFLRKFIAIMSPFIWGIVFAFFLIPLANRIEKHFPFKKKPTFRRTVVAIISVIIMILIIAAFFAILIPQLIASASQLIETFKGYINNATLWMELFSDNFVISQELLNQLYDYLSKFISGFLAFVQEYMPNIVQTTISTFTGIGNFVIGIIVALYILIDRDHLKRQLTKLSMALFSDRHHSRISMVIELSIEKFTHFFIGKVIDSVIIGIMTFISMQLLNIDYAILISFIVGVTNIIPFFGPFIGAIPSIFVLLIIDPIQALIFMILILVIQQIDGNLIGPTILGDSMGLSSLWIMFAIIVGGAYFGVFGMVVGVPIFAIVYYLIREFVNNRLEEKGISYPEDK